MKSYFLAFVAVPFIALGACSQEGQKTTTGAGGSGSGNGGTGQTGAGGGSGGDTGSGGATGNGGATGEGGATGSGGAGGITTTGAGGSSGGAGGGGVDAGAGGAGGRGGSGGGTGTGGAGGGGVTVDGIAGIPNNFGDSLKSSWILFPCYSQQAQDCITNPPGTACPAANSSLPYEQQGLTATQMFTVGGTSGQMYAMTIQVNGITEGKYYMGGTRAGGDGMISMTDPVGGLNMLYTGGQPVNFENYNVYKLTVNNTQGQEIQHYYLNSMPTGFGNVYENHNSFPEGYTATIPVMGGGTIVYLQADRNCHAIDNCGPGSRGTTCAVTAGRTIPNEPNAVIPTMYRGQAVSALNTRNGAAQPFHSQIMHITVTAVAPM